MGHYTVTLLKKHATKEGKDWVRLLPYESVTVKSSISVFFL